MEGLRERETALKVARAGHGGNRLAELDRQMDDAGKARDSRMARARRYGDLLAQAGLDPVATAAHFAARRREIDAAHEASRQAIADGDREMRKAAVEKGKLDEEAAGVNAELLGLQTERATSPCGTSNCGCGSAAS